MRVVLRRSGAGWTGLLGARLDVDEAVSYSRTVLEEEATITQLRGLLSGQADLDPDARGVCGGISATLTFDAVPAFLFDPPAAL